MTEAGVASSRPASALPADVDAAPEVSDNQLPTELLTTVASPQQASQFQLPPDIAEAPDKLCSAAVQVGFVICCVVQQVFWHYHHLVHRHTGQGGEAVGDTEQRPLFEC